MQPRQEPLPEGQRDASPRVLPAPEVAPPKSAAIKSRARRRNRASSGDVSQPGASRGSSCQVPASFARISSFIAVNNVFSQNPFGIVVGDRAASDVLPDRGTSPTSSVSVRSAKCRCGACRECTRFCRSRRRHRQAACWLNCSSPYGRAIAMFQARAGQDRTSRTFLRGTRSRGSWFSKYSRNSL